MKHPRLSLALAAALLMGAGSVHGQSSIRGSAQIALGDVLFVSADAAPAGALAQGRGRVGELVLHVSGNRSWQLTIQGHEARAGVEWRVVSVQGAEAAVRDEVELEVQPRVAAFGPRGRNMVVRVQYRAKSGVLPDPSELKYAVSAR